MAGGVQRQSCNNSYLDTVIYPTETGEIGPTPGFSTARSPRGKPSSSSLPSWAVCCCLGTPITRIESNYLVILTLRLFAIAHKKRFVLDCV